MEREERFRDPGELIREKLLSGARRRNEFGRYENRILNKGFFFSR